MHYFIYFLLCTNNLYVVIFFLFKKDLKCIPKCFERPLYLHPLFIEDYNKTLENIDNAKKTVENLIARKNTSKEKAEDATKIESTQKSVERTIANSKRKYKPCSGKNCQNLQARVYCGLCDEDKKSKDQIRCYCSNNKGDCFANYHKCDHVMCID